MGVGCDKASSWREVLGRCAIAAVVRLAALFGSPPTGEVFVEGVMKEETAWFSEEGGFFGANWLAQYEPSLSPEKSAEEVDFIERILSLKRGAKILDMPCGNGRHAVELAKRGYEVVGVDINNFLLRTATQTAQREKISMTLQRADMREVLFVGEFDVALNLFTSLGYFDDDSDDEKILDKLSCSLKRGGSLVLDFINRDHLVRTFRPRWERELSDGSMLITEPEYDLVRGRCVARRSIIAKGGKSPQKLTSLIYRMYTPTELIRMSRKSGLFLKRAYGDFKGSALTMNAERVILLFDKE
jgi:SAM-dependent methyltransferase